MNENDCSIDKSAHLNLNIKLTNNDYHDSISSKGSFYAYTVSTYIIGMCSNLHRK